MSVPLTPDHHTLPGYPLPHCLLKSLCPPIPGQLSLPLTEMLFLGICSWAGGQTVSALGVQGPLPCDSRGKKETLTHLCTRFIFQEIENDE